MATTTDYRTLAVTDDGPITRITLNRPERRNALSTELMTELTRALRAAQGRVVVLAGAGAAFCAGHDLDEMRGRDHATYERIFATCTELMSTIQEIPQPVIAAVHGIATAAGCQLAAACDLVVATDDSSFATPGVRVGIFCSTPMVELVRCVGRKRTMQMLMTGTPIDARTAADWGLVNTVVPPNGLDAAVADLAGTIAEASPLVVAIGKRVFHDQIDMPKPAAYAVAQAAMADNAVAHDAQEGICAFLDKRAPAWLGR